MFFFPVTLLLAFSMTYGNPAYPDLPTLPIYLSDNPYQRRNVPRPELPLPPQHVRQRVQPSISEDDEEYVEGNLDGENKLNSSLPISGLSNLLFSYDDPERTSFFLPLMILLVVHAMFLAYLHIYSPTQTDKLEEEEISSFLEYGHGGRRYYDVDGLRNKV